MVKTGSAHAAGVFTAQEGPVLPPPRGRDLLVEVRAVSVNPIDCRIRRGATVGPESGVLGFDAAGVVTSVGPTTRLFEVGDPVYYAGPAKTPDGMPSGSFGPTTAGRMDAYVDQFQAAGGSKVMLAKGNRSQAVTDACDAHGGFYLGSIGGPAAPLAEENLKKVECIDYPELGMEAVWKIEVVDFPAFILVDDKGNDFFKGLL